MSKNTIKTIFCMILAGASSGTWACETPNPIFGQVVAICGDQMVTYLGDEKVEVLGVETTNSQFELAYCSTGGGRKALFIQTHSEGFNLKSDVYERNGVLESYQISMGWKHLVMTGTDYNGNTVRVECSEYKDTRTDIDYIFRR